MISIVVACIALMWGLLVIALLLAFAWLVAEGIFFPARDRKDRK